MINIESISYQKSNSQLSILGSFEGDRLYAQIDKIRVKISLIEDTKFRLDIDLKKNTEFQISFYSADGPLILKFKSPMSKLSGRVSYWCFSQYQATHNNYSIFIRNKRYSELIVREMLFISAIATIWKHPRAAVMRLLYWVTKPILGPRNIWLFADKIFKAGDNAEYLYNYSIKQKDSAYKYYVLSPTSVDAKRFESEGKKYVRYRSLRQRLLFLHANILVFTHNNAPGFYRFGGSYEEFFRGLFNYDVMYIQHGLAVQNTPHLYDKSIDDIKQFFIASKFEEKNLLQPKYRYHRAEIVPIGMARYDGLSNDRGGDSKTILIAPTWRSYLNITQADYDKIENGHDDLTESDYYKIYSSLIQNNKLISAARRTGHSIVFALHPLMTSRVKSMRGNDSVSIVSVNNGLNYEKILIDARLMVTDYSGLQFDFAYMYKPVVYFHPPELPPSYGEAAYQYDKHAFGDIITSVNNLVDTLCDYMEKDMNIKQVYKKRIDNFFYYHDFKNSKRIYKSIVNWQNEN